MINYDGTIEQCANDESFVLNEKSESLVKCSDGLIRFGRRYFIDEYPFNGTMEEWRRKYKNHWLNYRTYIVNCLDGAICNKNIYPDHYFDIEDGILKSVSHLALIDIGRNDMKLLVIPEGITEIEYTFKVKGGISVILPNSLVKIRDGAFSDCHLLKHIEIQGNVMVIEEHAFGDSLKNAFRVAHSSSQYHIVRYNGSRFSWKKIITEELDFIPSIDVDNGIIINHL